jgi:hypothetical protein
MERKLVERAMHGDEEAFDALIGRVGDQTRSVPSYHPPGRFDRARAS